jgi:hypothetical protein
MMPQQPPQQPPYGHPQQGGYGAPPPGYYQQAPPTQEKHGQASLSMWLGLASFVTCGLTSIPAIILAIKANKEIGAQPGRFANSGHATAGLVTGCIGAFILLLAIVGLVTPDKDKGATAGRPAQVSGAAGGAGGSTNATNPGAGAGTTAAAVTPPPPRVDPLAALPESEKNFCAVAQSYAQQYGDAQGAGANQLKLSKLRSQRKQALLGLKSSVSGWLGIIDDLTTNGEGKASVSVKLPCKDVKVKTWNNALSDINDNTLIPQSSKLYDSISDLGEGKAVQFSGTFAQSDNDGLEESSVSEVGSMTDPEFIRRFSQMSAAK